MKKFLFTTAISSAVILLFACNDQSSPAAGEAAKDTSASTMETTPPASSVSKKTIPLSSANEVPVNNSTANGTAEVSYDKSSHMLTYTVSWSGLTGNASMAHIHGTAPKGSNAGVKKDLSSLLAKATSGSFSDSVMVDGDVIKEDSLLSGFYYFNIHTPANPGGEIRGQIEF